MIQERDDIVALDSAIIQHPRTWEASGHLAGFTDPLVDCRTCKQRFRADHLRGGARGAAQHDELRCGRAPSKLPGEHADCDLTSRARVQPDVRDDDRPGRGVRLDGLPAPGDRPGHLPRLQDHAAVRAQASRRSASRRSASPSATRSPRATSSSARSSSSRWRWSSSCRPPRRSSGTSTGSQRAHGVVRRARHRPREAAPARRTTPTSSRTTRAPPATSSTCTRSAGRSSRASPTAATSTSRQHQEFSGEKLEYVDPQTKERYLPHVIEPAAGLGRTILALLCDAYDEDEQGGEQRTVLRLHPTVAPIKVAVLPLLRKDGHPELAREVYEDLRGADERRVRRRRAHRQALPPPGRDRHPVRRHDRPPVGRRSHSDTASTR